MNEEIIELPNCKEIFIPDDEDWMFWNADYSSGDAYFVTWYSDCKFLKDIFKTGKDLYSVVASHYYQKEITKKDIERQIFKSICHGANYLGQAPTLAAKANLNIRVVNQVLTWYFKEAWEVREWHKETENFARKHGYVENIFGARFWVEDFKDNMWMNKMIALLPQSSVAILINKGLIALEKAEKGKNIRALMQIHDAGAGIYLKSDKDAPRRIKGYLEQIIPFDDPLIIPAEVEVSEKSYGNVKKIMA